MVDERLMCPKQGERKERGGDKMRKRSEREKGVNLITNNTCSVVSR